jgi:multiple sugar transport system substrate-binding protein
MKKRLVFPMAVVFIASAALNVFAAGGQDKKGDTDSSRPGQKIQLDFPSWQAEEPGFADFFRDIIAQFEKKHPNVTVNFNNLPYGQYNDTLITRFSANDPPDIVHLPTFNFMQYATQDWLSSLDSDLAGTGILEDWTGLQKSVVYKGQNHGLLLMGFGTALFYNEKILNEAGVKVPTSGAELVNVVKAVGALNKDYNGYGMTTSQHSNVYLEFAYFVIGNGSKIVRNGKYNFNDPALIKAAEDYRTISRYAPKGISSEMMRQLFVDGKIAMFMDGSYVAPLIDSAAPELKPYLKITKAPFAVQPGSISNSLHIAGTLKGERRSLVADFIKLVAEPANQVKYAEMTKSPAGRVSIASQVKDPVVKLANALAASAVDANPESEKLMAEYSRFVTAFGNYALRLQIADPSVSTASILSELENNLAREGLTP